MFVLDRAGRWYRLGLNDGCLANAPRVDSLAFGYTDGVTRIDKFTKVLIKPSGGSLTFNCQVDSVRRSEAPPIRSPPRSRRWAALSNSCSTSGPPKRFLTRCPRCRAS